ncbi:carbohydrate ABC transporter substrate-binding protein, CUT1 family [Sanguibacter gelidistatuariae]|uniref:Carbohydrate ABC transporter substrate-binding protein, CUT1 family n=1 Tax=Sanguibacter gelidistatuariae TaxID=1814289 RepID=A0A1G6MTB2_9MICO|nr:extracellular solute-binding protein [Sanguibacter gelidistatuariae]SDC58671.1 carbohydrate ABC transporter substrate-binding protein, CUT1 family [Sanguibacter gelidistatuariae]
MTQHRGSAFGLDAQGMSRRSLLKGGLIGAAALAFGGSILSACSSSGGGGTAAAGGSGLPLAAMPVNVPPLKPEPFLAGNAQGVMDVYKSFPLDGPKTVAQTVGDGSDFEFLVMTYGQPAPPLKENAYWQLLNSELNLNLKPIMVPYADFPTKFPALVAGDDLPEVVSVPMYMNVPRLPELAAAKFTDLSEYLAGDAVKKYPNLAGIQESAWSNSFLGGRLYGVPKSDPIFGGQLYTKTDLFEAAGVSEHPQSLEEFKANAAALTDSKAGVYAFGGIITDFMLQTFGVPNKWARSTDGTFVPHYEHEAFVPAIAAMADMYKAGYFHPDTATLEKTQRDAFFRTSRLAMLYDGNRAFGIISDDHDLKFGMARSFEKDGGTPVYWTGGGAYAITMLSKTDDAAKIDRFLKVMDWLSAPFGSHESFIQSYGAEGDNFDYVDGIPVLNDRGQREQDLGFAYIAGGPQILCNPQGAPDNDEAIHTWQTSVIPFLDDNPAQHLFSETANAKSGSLEQGVNDAIMSVFLGREPAATLEKAIKTWKTSGGDKMATEYAEAYVG